MSKHSCSVNAAPLTDRSLFFRDCPRFCPLVIFGCTLKAMPQPIRDFIANTGIVDVHEHHMPEILLNRDVNLLQLFQQSYAGWTQARPYTLPSETRDSDPMLVATGPTTWEALAPFLENSGSNSFVRNLVRAATELYGDGEPTITRKNWKSLDTA